MSDHDTTFPINGGNSHRRRPGPFGPAWALLPKDQQPLVLDGAALASDAIERLVDNGFSQIPVSDKEGKIIGVFSWKSLGKRVADLRATKIRATDLPIRDAMEPARFIHPEVYIDTETDWGNIDHVLVGSADKLMGILCIADVLGRLNDFAEAFVLLFEIEHEIRDLISDIVDDAGLAVLITNMALPPNAKPPKTLEDFSFSQYKLLICSKTNWPSFQPLFDTMRELIDADFCEINELRNTVFHFRRAITPKDTDRLRRFRDKLRYNRELFKKSHTIQESIEKCLNCKHLFGAVGIGQGARCKHPENKHASWVRDADADSSIGPMIPSKDFCCQYFEKGKENDTGDGVVRRTHGDNL